VLRQEYLATTTSYKACILLLLLQLSSTKCIAGIAGLGGQLVAEDGGVTSSDQLGVTMLQIAWVVERKELCGQDLDF